MNELRRGAFLADVALGVSYLVVVAASVGGCVALFLTLEFDPVITIVLSFPIGVIVGLTIIYQSMKLLALLKPKPKPVTADPADSIPSAANPAAVEPPAAIPPELPPASK